MKKLSISLFALLAICLAVTSAFTTKNSSKKLATVYEAWGITQDQVDVSPTPTQTAAYNQKISGTRFKQSTTDFDLSTEYANQLNSLQPIFFCNTGDNDDLCAAKIKLIDGTPESANVAQLLAGDYTPF